MKLERSLVSVAYEIIEKKGTQVDFNELFNQVCEILNIEDKNSIISYFYTQLTLDGRFVTLCGNVWDLRKRHKVDTLHDLHAYDYEDEEDEEEISEDEEDREDDELDKDPDEEDDLDESNDEEDDDYDSQEY